MTSPRITLRLATPADAPVVAALLTELGHPTAAADVPARLAAMLAQGGAAILAEADGAGVVAYMSLAQLAVIQAPAPVAYITALVTTAAWQGKGIGTQLVHEAFRWATARGCSKLSVTSGEQRAAAHAFYVRCGLPHSGRRFSVALERAGEPG